MQPLRRLTGLKNYRVRRTPEKQSAASSVSGEDRVEISSLSENIAASGDMHAARVQDIAALYASGRYSPDAMLVSRALVSHALQNGPVESEQ